MKQDIFNIFQSRINCHEILLAITVFLVIQPIVFSSLNPTFIGYLFLSLDFDWMAGPTNFRNGKRMLDIIFVIFVIFEAYL